RVSDRNAWLTFAAANNIADDRIPEFLQVIDKLEREKPEKSDEKLNAFGLSLDAVQQFIAEPDTASPAFATLLTDLRARGLDRFIKLDLGIVRGLAYYTGVVFEVFDLRQGMRAVAGGGRYDNLCELIGGKGAARPACGFAMGDVVIADLIRATPTANAQLTGYLSEALAFDAYIVVADEEKRSDAISVVQKLRTAGFRVEFPLTPTKVGKQFQAAENLQARTAVVIGNEFPTLKLKNLATRTETELTEPNLVQSLSELQTNDLPPDAPLIA
ncbi:MAG: ATP phosphoribosyltransferase regulatory subunit, partial [Verrucomicrobiales bacterium]|nr:ATP phosphoribosyltransferase regulatory subunit [Verrucomicrobiales bacterium]